MKVRVTFDHEPDEGDPNHDTGLTEEEADELYGQLMEIGAENIVCKQVPDAE